MSERGKSIDLGPLPELIGYVLRRAQLAVFQDFFAAFAPFDIRPAQFSALTIIERNPGLTQSQVAVVAEYLKAVNADLDLLRIMLRAAANEMNYLSNDDALAVNIRVWDEKRSQIVEPEYVVNKLDRSQAANAPRPVSANTEAKSRS